MNRLSRRKLLELGATGAAGAMAVPYLVPCGVLAARDKPGANQRVGIGAIGIGYRASALLTQLPAGGQIVALCDCDLPRAEGFKAAKKGSWPVHQDYRRLLERKDVDAVIIATAEFQRVLPCIHACQAGKDIYAEKPLTLYIREGRVLVEAVRKHARVFQVGSQQRSAAINRIACAFVRNGGLGKLLEVQAPNYPSSAVPPAEGFLEEHVPAGLNWDLWLNQAAQRPFNGQWMRWYRWRDFTGGETTNWGAHGIDQIQWALGMDGTGPVEMFPLPEGDGKVEMRYTNGVPLRFVLKHGPYGGGIFIGEKGKLEINRYKFNSNPKEIAAQLLTQVDLNEEEKKWNDAPGIWGATLHIQNWLDCIRTRQKPAADVEIGHRSISIAHLLNITRRLKRRLRWDPSQELFIGDDEANRLVDLPRRKGYELPPSA